MINLNDKKYWESNLERFDKGIIGCRYPKFLEIIEHEDYRDYENRRIGYRFIVGKVEYCCEGFRSFRSCCRNIVQSLLKTKVMVRCTKKNQNHPAWAVVLLNGEYLQFNGIKYVVCTRSVLKLLKG